MTKILQLARDTRNDEFPFDGLNNLVFRYIGENAQFDVEYATLLVKKDIDAP